MTNSTREEKHSSQIIFFLQMFIFFCENSTCIDIIHTGVCSQDTGSVTEWEFGIKIQESKENQYYIFISMIWRCTGKIKSFSFFFLKKKEWNKKNGYIGWAVSLLSVFFCHRNDICTVRHAHGMKKLIGMTPVSWTCPRSCWRSTWSALLFCTALLVISRCD